MLLIVCDAVLEEDRVVELPVPDFYIMLVAALEADGTFHCLSVCCTRNGNINIERALVEWVMGQRFAKQ